MWWQKYFEALSFLFTKIWIVTDQEYASMPQVFHLDDYDRCMADGSAALYCSISFQLFPKNPENASDVWKIIEKVSNGITYYRHDLLRHGICVSQRCPQIPKSELLNYNDHYIEKLSECYSAGFKEIDVAGNIKTIRCEMNQPYSTDSYDYAFGRFVWIIIATVLMASLCNVIWGHNFTNKKTKSTVFSRFVSSFSIIQNWKRLTRIDLNNPDAKALSSLQGVRFYNVVGVIIAHTLTTNMAVPILNPRYMESLRDRKIDQFWGLGSRYVTMQTFFLLSVWLLTYKFCKEMEDKKEVTFLYLIRRIINRYIRLTPLMIVVMFWAATWMRHLSKGPLWDSIVGTDYTLCRKNWWINVLYVSNFFPFHDMCANHLWYLAVDVQFYILALLFLWIMWKHPIRTSAILVVAWLLHVVNIYLKIRKMEFKEISPESCYNTTLVNMEQSLNFIKATTINIPALLAGVIYGRIFYKYRNTKLLTKRSHVIIWWIVSVTTAMGTIVLPGFIINFFRYYTLYMLYMCFSRTVFVFGTGLFFLGMTQGHGGIIRKACEWSPVYILGRLTYGAYLIHPFLQHVKIGLLRTPNFLNDYLLVFECLGHITWSFFISTPLTLFFEMPFEEIKINTFKIIDKKRKSDHKTD